MRSKITPMGKSVLLIITYLVLILNITGKTESITEGKSIDGGHYGVGFRTMELYDYSRTARENYDYFGNILEREIARPIQISYWYPALVSKDDLPMVVSEYNFPYPEDSRFIDYLSEIQNREIAYFQRLTGNQDSVFGILNSETGAFRNAPFVDGKFPLIVYIPDGGHGISENFELMEYLAARGYLVATVHSVGTFQRDPAPNPMDLETVVRDAEFALSSLRDHPNITESKIGVMGCGFGADVALLLKMRNYDIDAVVCLYDEPAPYDRKELLGGNPFYDPDRVNVPVLQMAKATVSEDYLNIVDSLVYSGRYAINFLPNSGVCLTDYDKYLVAGDSLSDNTKSVSEKSYDALCSYACSFFDAFLSGVEKAVPFRAEDPAIDGEGSDLAEIKFLPARKAPPTEAQFMSIIENQGPDTAVALYRKFKPKDPDHIFFREGVINIAGYRLLQSGRTAEALTLFELNTKAYPNSANVWDSYGEACLATGDLEKALENYKKALETLPHDTTTAEALKTVIENGASQQIQRIEELINQSETEENQ